MAKQNFSRRMLHSNEAGGGTRGTQYCSEPSHDLDWYGKAQLGTIFRSRRIEADVDVYLAVAELVV